VTRSEEEYYANVKLSRLALEKIEKHLSAIVASLVRVADVQEEVNK